MARPRTRARVLGSLGLLLFSALFGAVAGSGPPHHHQVDRRATPAPTLAARQAPATPTSSVNIPESAAAGGITWTNPAATAAAVYYKIASGQQITFGWNFTSVLSYGTSLTLQAYCSLNSVTYPIATLPATATAVTMDPYASEQSAGWTSWAQATYTMRAFDERGLNAGLKPGLMAPNTGLQFAMYRPQPYQPLASWNLASSSTPSPLSVQGSALLVATLASLTAAVLGGWFGVLASIH